MRLNARQAGAFLLVLALTTGCAKISDSEKRAASNIISGLAGGTADGLAEDALAPRRPGSANRVGSYLKSKMNGLLWLTRFQLETGKADLVIDSALCNTGDGVGGCTASCNSPPTAYTIACALPGGSIYTCEGVDYSFSDASFSITADFTATTGSQGSATGNFDIGITIAADISGGELKGDRLDCSMNFTIDIAAMKLGNVDHISPNCTNFSCTYDGDELPCADVQAQMASSPLTCG